MRLYVTSDLHLEFGDLEITNEHDVDVLILSGDIFVAADIGTEPAGGRIRAFFDRVSSQFPHTILIMGNHEHYHGDFSKSYDIIKNMLQGSSLANIYLLEKESKVIGDYLFIGGTLWTDFNRGDPLTMLIAKEGMNDYRGVKNTTKGHRTGVWKFLPEDVRQDHLVMKKYIQQVIIERRGRGDLSDRVIVVGHHSPSRQSTHPRYQQEYHVNGSYSSDLDQFILDHPEICLWTHGHTHEDFDYHIGNTRIVCNPRGYIGHEARADTWKPKLIEL